MRVLVSASMDTDDEQDRGVGAGGGRVGTVEYEGRRARAVGAKWVRVRLDDNGHPRLFLPYYFCNCLAEGTTTPMSSWRVMGVRVPLCAACRGRGIGGFGTW